MFGLKFSGKGWVQPRLLQCLQRGGYSLVEAVEALGLFRERFRCFNGCFLRWRGEEGYKQPRGRIEKFLGQRRSRVLPEGRDVGWNSGCPQIEGDGCERVRSVRQRKEEVVHGAGVEPGFSICHYFAKV